jgi:hypothetical protein
MTTFSAFVRQLKRERDLVERRLSGLNAALAAFAAVYRGKSKPAPKRRKMSAAARKKIAAAQKARWAEVRAKQKGR